MQIPRKRTLPVIVSLVAIGLLNGSGSTPRPGEEASSLLRKLAERAEPPSHSERDRVFSMASDSEGVSQFGEAALSVLKASHTSESAAQLVQQLSHCDVFVRRLFSIENRRWMRKNLREGDALREDAIIELLVEVGDIDDYRGLEALSLEVDDDKAAKIVYAMNACSLLSREFAKKLIGGIPLQERETSKRFAAALSVIAATSGEGALQDLVSLYREGPTLGVRSQILAIILRRHEDKVPIYLSRLDMSLVDSDSRSEVTDWELSLGYSMWWTLVSDLEDEERRAAAVSALKETTNVDVGTDSDRWVKWWRAGGRPQRRAGALDAQFLKWAARNVGSSERLLWFSLLVHGGWIDEARWEAGKEAYAGVYDNTSIDMFHRVSAAGASARIGDRRASKRLIEWLQYHLALSEANAQSREWCVGIHRELRRVAHDNAYDDCSEWLRILDDMGMGDK